MSDLDIPISITAQGLQPQSPDTLRSLVETAAAAQSPGYTANLPGILIEDVLSTSVASLAQIDQAKVETVNSLDPSKANVPLLLSLGAVYGVPYQQPNNTSVLMVFSGTVGYVIPNGFQVTDGTNVFSVKDGGVIASSGSSLPITAIAITPGAFSLPYNTVTQFVTSVPAGVQLTCFNTAAATPGTGSETYASYRSRVLDAGLASSVSTPRYIKTLLNNLTGVTQNLVSVQPGQGGLRVVAGGADPYDIAYAIFMSVSDPTDLVGSAVDPGRNVTVSLFDAPDTFPIVYVITQIQTMSMSVAWNTTLKNFTGGAAFPSLTQQPLASYLNSLAPGQVINELEMIDIFKTAVAGVINPNLITRLVFSVYINGALTQPATGTYAISGDPEGYFFINTTDITVTQG